MKFNKTFEKVFDEAVTWQQVVIYFIYWLFIMIMFILSAQMGVTELFDFLTELYG